MVLSQRARSVRLGAITAAGYPGANRVRAPRPCRRSFTEQMPFGVAATSRRPSGESANDTYLDATRTALVDRRRHTASGADALDATARSVAGIVEGAGYGHALAKALSKRPARSAS